MVSVLNWFSYLISFQLSTIATFYLLWARLQNEMVFWSQRFIWKCACIDWIKLIWNRTLIFKTYPTPSSSHIKRLKTILWWLFLVFKQNYLMFRKRKNKCPFPNFWLSTWTVAKRSWNQLWFMEITVQCTDKPVPLSYSSFWAIYW